MGTLLIIKNADFSSVAVATIDLGLEIPTINLNVATKLVTLSVSDESEIFYTTNGDTPTTGSTKYTTPFTVDNSATIKAISSDGTSTSSVPKVTGTLTIDEESIATLTLQSSVSGTIRYTTNGNDPTSSSSAYSSAITVSEGQTYKVAVFDGSTMVSKVATFQITA